MLAAGDASQPIQPIDVRDLSLFALDLISHGVGGVFNVAAPTAHATYGELIRACVEVTGSRADLVWVDPAWLSEQDVREWTEIPLWRKPAGSWAIDVSHAREAGLVCRPLPATVADTWIGLRAERPVPHVRQAEHGLDPAKEAQLLALWDARHATQ